LLQEKSLLTHVGKATSKSVIAASKNDMSDRKTAIFFWAFPQFVGMRKLHVSHAENAACMPHSGNLDAASDQTDRTDVRPVPRKMIATRICPMAIMTNRPLGAGSSASRLLADLFGRIAAWNDARVTRKSLSALTDRELEDLGLVRGDIDDIARGTYQRG
jgi:uncharacterized protein YjiS (DUF1127 family)